MSNETEFRSFVLEQLRGVEPFETKNMFGGLALLRNGKAFGKVKHGALWLKVDASTRGRFEERGMPQYAYGKNNDRHLDFFQAPAEVLEDANELAKWADTAAEAAERT